MLLIDSFASTFQLSYMYDLLLDSFQQTIHSQFNEI